MILVVLPVPDESVEAKPVVPVTASVVSVPTLVILGCAAVVTVPAVVALPALVAKVALATVPVTFAPVIDARFAPDSPAANVADEPIALFTCSS